MAIRHETSQPISSDESWVDVLMAGMDRQPQVKILDRLADLAISGAQSKHVLSANDSHGRAFNMYIGPFNAGAGGRNPYHTVYRAILNNVSRTNQQLVNARDYTLDVDSGEVGLCESRIIPMTSTHSANTGPWVRFNGNTLKIVSGDQYDKDLAAALDASIDLDGEQSNLDRFLIDTETFLTVATYHAVAKVSQAASY